MTTQTLLLLSGVPSRSALNLGAFMAIIVDSGRSLNPVNRPCPSGRLLNLLMVLLSVLVCAFFTVLGTNDWGGE